MSGIGWTEFIVIAFFLLVFVGPKHMPSMLKKFGKIVSELRTASRELRNQIEVEMDDIPTPSSVMKDVSSDIKDDLLSPYNDVIEDAKKLKNEVKGTVESESTAEETETSTTKKDTP